MLLYIACQLLDLQGPDAAEGLARLGEGAADELRWEAGEFPFVGVAGLVDGDAVACMMVVPPAGRSVEGVGGLADGILEGLGNIWGAGEFELKGRRFKSRKEAMEAVGWRRTGGIAWETTGSQGLGSSGATTLPK